MAGGNGVGRFKLYMCLRKMCPKCGTIVHVKRAVCGCGHAFALKRKAHCCVGSKPERKRKEKDSIRKARGRSSETHEQTVLDHYLTFLYMLH